MTFELFVVQDTGSPGSWAYPAIGEDFSPVWEAIDGEVVGPIHATAMTELAWDKGKNKFDTRCGIQNVDLYFYVTESRLVFVCRNHDKGGGWIGIGLVATPAAIMVNAVSKHMAANRARVSALVGQIRYPWMESVQFWQKTTWKTSDNILIFYTHPDGVERCAKIELGNHDVVDIAYRLKHHAVHYRLCDRDPKTEKTTAYLNTLLATGPAHAAVRGELVDYDIGEKSVPAGTGEELAPLHAPSSGLNVPVPATEQSAHASAPQNRVVEHGTIDAYEPNEPESYSHPAVNDDLSVQFDARDGHIIGPLLASGVEDLVVFNVNGRPKEVSVASYTGDRIAVYVTETRIVYMGRVSQVGLRDRLVGGHLRYPWVCMVGYATKQNWLTDELLRLFYEGDDGLHIIAITFEKTANAASVATTVLQRIAAYHLASRAQKAPEVVQQLQMLYATPHLPTPKKYQHAIVDIPVYSRMGRGEEDAPIDAPSRVLNQGATPTPAPAQHRTATAPSAGSDTPRQFNSPPNWPTPPPGWTPPAGWQPDASWPAAPPGWRFWT